MFCASIKCDKKVKQKIIKIIKKKKKKIKIFKKIDFNNINWNFILNHIFEDWNWDKLSEYVPFEYVSDYPYLPWDYQEISCHNDVDYDFVLNFKDFNWNWDTLSEIVPFKYVSDNPNLPWDYKEISTHSDIDWDFVLKFSDSIWDWVILSKKVPWKIVKKQIYLNWCLETLSKKRYIDWEFVHQNDYLNWDWYYLSCHTDIPDWFLNIHINKFTDLDLISKIVSLEILLKYPNKNWNFRNIALYNRFIIWKNYKDNPQIPWDYIIIFHRYKRIDWDYIIQNPDLNWDYSRLVTQNKIPYQFLLIVCTKFSNYPDYIKYCIDLFSKNMCLNNQLVIDNKDIDWNYNFIEKNIYIKKDQAARIIQKHWLNCRYNPKFKMCRIVQLKNYKLICDEYNQTDNKIICKEPVDTVKKMNTIINNSMNFEILVDENNQISVRYWSSESDTNSDYLSEADY